MIGKDYAKEVNIEARTMIDMASKSLIPSCVKYTKSLADTVIALKEAGADYSLAKENLDETVTLVTSAKAALKTLIADTDQAGALEAGLDQAAFYRDIIKNDMAALRAPIDTLEMIVDKDYWPMPSYGDLLFEV